MNTSKWTFIYADFDDGGIFYYPRFCPDFMELEAAGFPHGLALAGCRFRDREEAEKYQKVLDVFFEQMIEDLKNQED